MKILRIVGAAFLVLFGALLIVSWSVAGKAVTAIESGEAASNITEKLLEDPDFARIASERIADRLVERTDGNFVGRLVAAFEPELAKAIESVLTADRVNDAVSKSVDKVENQLTEELTKPDRPTGPFVITIDLSDRVNARIDQIPVVGTFIPEVTVPPIERELIDATTFDQVRQVYSGLKLVAGWGFIVGVLLIFSGFWVAPRSKWYWSQALFGVFFLIFAIGLVTRRLIPKTIAGALPGGEEGAAGSFVGNFISTNAIKPITSGLIWLAFFSLVLAVAFALIARFLPGWRNKPATVDAAAGDQAAEPMVAAYVAPQGAPTPVATVVPAEVAVAEEVIVADAAVSDADPAGQAAAADAETVPAPETIVVESPASAPAEAPAKASTAKAKPAATKATAAKASTAKPPTAKTTPAKATPAKTPPTKATPAKTPPAKPTPAKPATRTRKPPAKDADS